MSDISQYTTVAPFMGQKASWVGDALDQERIAAYATYEQLYDNVAKTLKLLEESGRSLYIPSARVIVETMQRYLAPKLNIVPDPAYGDSNQQLLATQVITDFLRRERFVSKFNTNKRWGLIRGDWAFHLYADPTRAPGTMISCFGVDPSSLFPIYNPQNIDEIIGWHIVDFTVDNDGNSALRRLTYRKLTGTGGPSPITVEDALFDPTEWGGPGMAEEDVKQILQIVPQTQLPNQIDQLPIYTIPNRDRPGALWGTSELQGLEGLVRALSQGYSDEDLTLAMDGIGVWVTDSGTPVDDNGDEVPWNIGPGRVVEIQTGRKFNREPSSVNVDAYQGHLKGIGDWMDQASGQSPASRGLIDVGVAESGIALQLNLAPILSSAEEKEQIVTDVVTNMFYDLAKWFVAYEGGAFNSLVEATRWIPRYGPKLPTNYTQERADVVTLVGAKIISTTYARDRMRRLGYDDMPDEATISAQISAEAALTQDAFGARVDGEVNAQLDTGNVGG